MSWIISSNENIYNCNQSAYQIIVSSSPDKLTEKDADLWSSGKVKSDACSQIAYNGVLLHSEQKCYWKVRVWVNNGDYSLWSETAEWGMGLIEEKDWQAQWIGDKPDATQKAYTEYLENIDQDKIPSIKNIRPVPPASPVLRKKFPLKKEIESALLYVSALGYYEISLNGKKVGDHVLAPEWTDYNMRVQYQVYDVKNDLWQGDNVLSAVLGDGWYLGMIGPTKWHRDYPRRGVYGNDRRLIARLSVTYKDGTKDAVCSDGSWKINSTGYIIDADNFLGEKIDARLQDENWTDPGFNDDGWGKVYVDNDIIKNLEFQKNEPVRIYKYLPPVKILQSGGKYIVDFGQNITGWIKLRITGTKGSVVRIRHGEMLDEDGSLYTANLAAAVQTDEYILSGKEDIFEPSFTYHGFRYAEISGLKEAPGNEMITACAISSDPEVTGAFECSNPKLNKLWENILWTQRNNMTSVPTDCPQRDERMGWMGDAQVFCQTSMYNMDMAAFYTKWVKDIRDAQSARGTFPDIAPHSNKPDIRFSNAPAWADAGIIIPWRMYENYGDRRLLEEHYEAMKRYIENIKKQNPDFLWLNDVGNQYGDWLNANTIIAEGYSSTRGEVPRDVFATGFYANSARLMSKIASVLGKNEEAKEYLSLFEKIRTEFNLNYVGKDGRIKGNTQSAYALALNFNLLPKDMEEPAFRHLIECIEEYDYRISTGFITTIMMMKELVKRGRLDIAYLLIESERFPSWIYSINQGATTIWERWDGYVKGRGFQDPGMNSFCHYSIGAVGEWMYRIILGINSDENNPGWKQFTIHPQPGGTLKWARGFYKSINGTISVDWVKKDKIFSMNVEIPVNTRAEIRLPASDGSVILCNSKKLNNFKFTDGIVTFMLGSGKYMLSVE